MVEKDKCLEVEKEFNENRLIEGSKHIIYPFQKQVSSIEIHYQKQTNFPKQTADHLSEKREEREK